MIPLSILQRFTGIIMNILALVMMVGDEYVASAGFFVAAAVWNVAAAIEAKR